MKIFGILRASFFHSSNNFAAFPNNSASLYDVLFRHITDAFMVTCNLFDKNSVWHLTGDLELIY